MSGLARLDGPVAQPVLETGRLALWQPQASDLADMIALVTPEETRRFLGAKPAEPADQFARLLRNAGSWSLYGYGAFAVRLIGEPAIVATCGVFRSWRGFGQGMDNVPEAGWIVAHAHCGRGIAGEAMRTALAWFDAAHGPARITCMIDEHNAASHRLALSLGFAPYARYTPAGGTGTLVLYQRQGG